MRKLLPLILFLTSCSTSAVQETSNFVVSQNRDDFNITQKENDFVATQTWKVNVNDSNARIASVSANGKTPNGEVQTLFNLQCPPEQNPLVSIEYIVRDSNKTLRFSFDDFEGPDAPAQKKKLVEIRAISPYNNLSFHTAVSGYYVADEMFAFGLGTIKQDQISQLARMVAEGSTEVTFIIHDYRDYRKTIETTFPAIDVSSDVAKTLNGCRK